MGELSAPMLAVLKSAEPEVYVLVTIVGEDATYRWTHAQHGAVSSMDAGLYEGRIISAGKVSQILPSAGGSLNVPQTTLVVDDVDLAVTEALWDIDFRRAVTIKLGAKGVDAADYFDLFSGVVEGLAQKQNGQYEVKCRLDDSWLDIKVPQSRFDIVEHPNLDPDVEGLAVPVFAGYVGGYSQKGNLPTYYVGGAAERFMIAGHRATSPFLATPAPANSTLFIRNADNDWTSAATAPATWVYGEVIIYGQTYCYVEVGAVAPAGWAGAYPGATPEVRCRFTMSHNEFGSVWEGASGVPDLTPDSVWTYILDYFGWRNWRQGKWTSAGPGAAPIAAAPIGTYERPYRTPAAGALMPYAAGWLGGNNRIPLRTFLKEFCDNFAFYSYFDWSGTLQALWWDYLVASPYPSETIDWDAPGVRDMRLVRGKDDDFGRIVAFCNPDYSLAGQAEWGETFAVEDIQAAGNRERKVQYSWQFQWNAANYGTNWQVRNFASQSINRFRRRLPDLTCVLPLWYLDYTLGQDFGVAWDRGPNPDGTSGWSKANNWSRRMYRLAEMVVDLDRLEISQARLEYSQSAQATFWATYRTRRSTTNKQQEGVCELGVVTEFDRIAVNGAADLWVDDPSTGTAHLLNASAIQLDSANATMYPDAAEAQGGVMVQRAQTQRMLGSFFDSANWGSWAAFGGAIYTRNTNARFYDEDATLDGYAVLTAPAAPDPIGAFAGITQTSAALSLSYGAVAITFRGIFGNNLYWQLTRSGGGNNTWNDTTKAWGVTQSNALSMVDETITRFRSNGIPLTGAGITYQLGIFFSAAAEASSQIGLYEGAFLTDVPWVGSRIKAAAAAATRTASSLSYYANNDNDDQAWPDVGSLEIEVMPQFNSLDLPRSGATEDQHSILDMRYAATDRWYIYTDWVGGAYKLVFTVVSGGATTTASVEKELARGRRYKIRALFSGPSGELGLADHSYQISIEGAGAKATSAVVVGAAAPVYAAGQRLYVGSNFTPTVQWDGWIGNPRIKPYVEAV